MKNIFHTTGRYRYLLSMTYRVGFWVGTVKKPHCTKFQNHSFVDVRLNAEYLKEGQRHRWIFQSKASEPGMPGWVHPTEVVRATSCSNQLAFLSKQGVKEWLCHDLRLGYLAFCPMCQFHLNLLQKFNFAQGSLVDPIFRLCPEMKEQVDIDGLTWVALNFFSAAKLSQRKLSHPKLNNRESEPLRNNLP